MDPTADLTPQHHQLMPKCGILGLKPEFRFEWRPKMPVTNHNSATIASI
jgi:hypothetical protein